MLRRKSEDDALYTGRYIYLDTQDPQARVVDAFYLPKGKHYIHE